MKSVCGLPLANLGKWSKEERVDAPISKIMGVDQHDMKYTNVNYPQERLTELSSIISVDFPTDPVVKSYLSNIFYSPNGPDERRAFSLQEYVTLPEGHSEAEQDLIFELIWDAWTDWIEYNDWNLSEGSIGEFNYKIGRAESPEELNLEKQYIQRLPDGMLRWEIGPEPDYYPGIWFDIIRHQKYLIRELRRI
jgi:hypothetical protein